MRSAKISELKAKLSAHIEYVKSGEEVLIIDRNKPVARLVPVGPIDDQDEQMQRLIATGVLIPPLMPRIKGEEFPEPRGPISISNEIMDQVWRVERDDR